MRSISIMDSVSISLVTDPDLVVTYIYSKQSSGHEVEQSAHPPSSLHLNVSHHQPDNPASEHGSIMTPAKTEESKGDCAYTFRRCPAVEA
jgi:hypothetical protein